MSEDASPFGGFDAQLVGKQIQVQEGPEVGLAGPGSETVVAPRAARVIVSGGEPDSLCRSSAIALVWEAVDSPSPSGQAR
eukprot:4344300-Pyramimonas_sp.AAC.1